MKLQVRKCNPPTPRCFSQAQLEEIANSLEVVEKSKGTKEVFFGEYPPHDVCLPWQKTEPDGTPIGKIKYYKNGNWS